MNLNRATLIGNVTHDPEVRSTSDGTQVCNFSVATNMIWKDQQGNKQERAEYHNIVAWRKLAEICAQFLTKGRKIYVEGRLQTRSWEDQSGVKRYRTEIIADNMILLDSRRDGGRQQGGASSNQTPPPKPQEPQNSFPPSTTQSTNSSNDVEEINVEEIPF